MGYINITKMRYATTKSCTVKMLYLNIMQWIDLALLLTQDTGDYGIDFSHCSVLEQ